MFGVDNQHPLMPSQVDMAGLTPLMYACASGLEENIKFLLKKKVLTY